MFCSQCYSERYPDLKAAFNGDHDSLVSHYQAHGQYECRTPACSNEHLLSLSTRKPMSETTVLWIGHNLDRRALSYLDLLVGLGHQITILSEKELNPPAYYGFYCGPLNRLVSLIPHHYSIYSGYPVQAEDLAKIRVDIGEGTKQEGYICFSALPNVGACFIPRPFQNKNNNPCYQERHGAVGVPPAALMVPQYGINEGTFRTDSLEALYGTIRIIQSSDYSILQEAAEHGVVINPEIGCYYSRNLWRKCYLETLDYFIQVTALLSAKMEYLFPLIAL